MSRMRYPDAPHGVALHSVGPAESDLHSGEISLGLVLAVRIVFWLRTA